MDALKGIGHACGHNLIGMAGTKLVRDIWYHWSTLLIWRQGVAVSLGLRAALEKHNIPGKIVLLGTPGLSLLKRNFG